MTSPFLLTRITGKLDAGKARIRQQSAADSDLMDAKNARELLDGDVLRGLFRNTGVGHKTSLRPSRTFRLRDAALVLCH